ncbi:hypothetical protein [Acidovorax sp. FJL06]|uniref:hypothetical protein n=1 Tax=Acidovorax sp. FJL06 TaxID=2153365 RepID=UPI000F575329|nr:hypothetical protein [Acidovorax sp. FJL06]RQO83530.1 hypothetical protein DBV10_04190 [Acidovorax sp. FJL06]
MPVPPITRDAITAALKECGPMTVPELVEYLGWPRTRVDSCITTARENHPGKLFRIVRYRKQVGIQGREAAVYAAGPGPDAQRPAFDAEHHLEAKRRYYRGNRAIWAAKRKARTGQRAASPWSGLLPMARRAA